jgi:hypothetical protein
MEAGAHPKNTGGKRCRSGRPPSEFKKKLEQIRDEQGLPVLEAILSGRIPGGVCAHCGAEASSDAVCTEVPIDARLRAADMTLRYTIGLTKTIKLDGVRGVAEAFEMIRSRIRVTLAPEQAERLISSIHEDLRKIR